MSRPLKERAYGQIPDDFDDMLIKACDWQPQARPARPVRRALVIACCLVLIACTALAVAQGLRLIDLFGVGRVDPDEAAAVIDTAVTQTGGSTTQADFTVQEVFYDGTFVRFAVGGAPTSGGVLLDARFMAYPEQPGTAALPGPRYGVAATAHTPQLAEPLPMYLREEGGSLLLFASTFLPEGTAPDALDMTIDIDMLDIDSGAVLGSTALAFTARRTAEPATRTYNLDITTDYVTIHSVKVARTPLEAFVSIEYTPLLRVFGGFMAVPEDGYIRRYDRTYTFGTYGGLHQMQDGVAQTSLVLPVEHADGDTLTLWISSTDLAVVLNLQTGEATIKEAALLTEGEDTRIEIKEDAAL